MANPSSSLGIPYEFDSDGFRAAIRFAMEMGVNPDPDRRPIFLRDAVTGPTYWKAGVLLGSTPRLDGDGVPLDPDVEVREAAVEQIAVDCAVEVERPGQTDETPVGMFAPTRLVV